VIYIKSVKIAGFFGIIAGLVGLLGAFMSISLCGEGCGEGIRPWIRWGSDGSFSWRSNALSDLGVSRVADIFNYSLIATGVFNFIFTVGFMKAYSKDRLHRLGSIATVLGGGSLSLVGIITEDQGLVQHAIVSMGYFILFPAAMIILGISFTRKNRRIEGWLSTSAGIAALSVILGSLVLQLHQRVSLGFAVPEMIESIIIASWIIWMGSNLMRFKASNS